MDLTELSRKLENVIRVGTVLAVDHAAVRCRVKTGQLETEWLRWHTPRAGATLTWDPPTLGEQVVVLSPSGEIGNGVVFYGFNSDDHPAPSASPDTHLIRFPDGATFRYDHASSHLEISGIRTASVTAAESITLVAGEKIVLDTPLTHCTGQLTADDLLSYGNGLSGTGGTHKNSISGDFTHAGGEMSSNGIVVDTHHHAGVIKGGDESGDPV